MKNPKCEKLARSYNNNNNNNTKAVKIWKVKLTARRKILAEVKILRGLFLGDALIFTICNSDDLLQSHI